MRYNEISRLTLNRIRRQEAKLAGGTTGRVVMSRRAEGISITESTGRGVALSAELSLQPVQAYSIFTGHIAGNLLFSGGEETVTSPAKRWKERARFRYTGWLDLDRISSKLLMVLKDVFRQMVGASNETFFNWKIFW